jgi:hypothetical protein
MDLKNAIQILISQTALSNKDFKSKILSETISYCRSSKEDFAIPCNSLVGHLKIAGFRNAQKAPVQRVVNNLMKLVDENTPELFNDILSSWLHSQYDLKDKCIDFIERLDDGTLSEIRNNLSSENSNSILDSRFDSFFKEKDEKEIDRNKLAIWYLILLGDEMFDSQSDELETNEINQNRDFLNELSPLWQECLNKLELSSLDSKEWSEVEQFFSRVEILKTQKTEEIQRTKEIKTKINDLLSIDGISVIFDLEICKEWSKIVVPEDSIESVTQLLDELKVIIERYKKDEPRVYEKPKTPEQRKEKQSFLLSFNQLGENLNLKIHQISEKFESFDEEPKRKDISNESNLTTKQKPKTISSDEEGFFTNDTEKVIAEDVPETIEQDPESFSIFEKNREDSDFEAVPETESRNNDKKKETESIHPIIDNTNDTVVIEAEVVEDETDGENISTENTEETEVVESEIDFNLFIKIAVTDDLGAGYWLSYAYENEKVASLPIPSWMFAALIGSRFIDWESDQFISDLLEITKIYSPSQNEDLKLLGLAASIKTALIAPASGMASWLSGSQVLPQIQPLVDAIKEFSNRQYPLKERDLLGLESKEDRQTYMNELALEIRNFVDEATKREFKYGVATRVWRSFISPKGQIGRLFEPVLKNDRNKVGYVKNNLKDWMREEFVESQIKSAQRNWLSASRDIIASPKRHLNELIRQSVSHLTKWVHLIERENQINDRGDWLTKQLMSLKKISQDTSESILSALEELHNKSNPIVVQAGSWILARSLLQLYHILRIQVDDTIKQRYSLNLHHYFLKEASVLTDILHERLVWWPDLIFTDEYRFNNLTSDKVTQMINKSSNQGNPFWEAAKGWIECQDYRFVDSIIEYLKNCDLDEHLITEIETNYETNLEGSRESLKAAIDNATETIEQALVDGIIHEELRSELLNFVEQINPEKEKQFSKTIKELKIEIDDRINRLRKERLEYLKNRWNDIEIDLAQRIGNPIKNNIISFIDERFQREDTRNIEECLAHLKEVCAGVTEINIKLFEKNDVKTDIVNFSNIFTTILKWLENNRGLDGVLRIIKSRGTKFSLSYQGLLADRIDSAQQAALSFIDLKKGSKNKSPQLRQVQTLLQFLGYRPYQGESIQIDTKKFSADVLHVLARVTASNLARPISEFGSKILGGLNVVVLWERPVADTIVSIIQELRLEKQGVLVIYLGRLTQAQRRKVLQSSRSENLTIAVLDEVLFTYLTFEKGVRLKAFLGCSLPFTKISPYKPFEAGDIPPEIFYGRNDLTKEISPEGGTCLIYGGRQLGKSAFLREVQRSYHYPENEHYAWVEDIRAVGDPTNREAARFKEEICERLRDGLKKLNLIPKDIRTNSLNRLKSHITKLMEERPERRILVLFDEADHFLEADASEDFPVIQELKTIMADTNRRFKVVFAGLHAVQRFQGIRNQPLAHFGTPIQIGPLAPHDAVMLVQEPMSIIGFEMDYSTILRILSYTNYHAGLIQFFCKKLIERATRAHSNPNNFPPFKITRSDVESVYRDHNVRDEIRQRLELTLMLDTRYEAITWALIFEQMDDKDSYSRAFAANEALNLAREHWPKGFSEVENDAMRSCLDEMCGLGVLVKNANGFYRLRSPNVVRLMGSESDILSKLSELSDKMPDEEFKPDSHHSSLSRNFKHYSPLTYAQERDLMPQGFGVSIIFASPANGLDNIQEAINSLIPKELKENGTGHVYQMPEKSIHANTIKEELNKVLNKNSKLEQIITALKPACNSNNLRNIIKSSIKFCNEKKNRIRNRWMKVIVVMTPEMTENWISIDDRDRESLENCCDAVLSLRLWNDLAIRNRLKQLNKMFSSEVTQEIYEATGGWPMLLNYLFENHADEDNLSAPAKNLKKQITEKGSEIYASFSRAICIGGLKASSEVLNEFLKEKEIPLDLVPELNEIMCDGETNSHITQRDVIESIEYMKRLRIINTKDEDLVLNPIIYRMLSV